MQTVDFTKRLTIKRACPVCKVEQVLDVKISQGPDEIKPGVFFWVERGTPYAVCAYKNCRHVLTPAEI